MTNTETHFNPRREERWDYPMDAMREIVINMNMHRDYRSSNDSTIKIFDDRIEFFNSGKLLDDLTVEKITWNLEAPPRLAAIS
jgi:ATP-dependent DNA helicase RecG